ncbi:MucBP domain-containing protein [Vagococcus hydrophili]|uniref:MucBP domain-containing protein n=1 Tax=Vagococcus hydrophili TaxID=2714947 RepID=A0A6G8ASS9_9ENTE|nr:MucBP domain-containing protein [Vagococcus hydrophili]QIL48131.1 MucBP domain-containing protein [Vagococcus hydrophili]
MKKKLLTTLLLSTLVLPSITGVTQVFAETAATDTSVNAEYLVQPVIVKYVDESGVTISDEEKLTGDLGGPYEVKPKTIENYTYKSSDTELKGKYTTEKQIIILTYSKIDVPVEKGSVLVSYVDEKGTTISTDETKTGNVGAAYNVDKKAISGYSFNKVKEGNLVGEFTSEAQHVVLEYKENAKKSNVTVKYIDDKNIEIKKPVTFEGEVGTKAPITKEVISGYEFVSGSLDVKYTEEAQTITHTYKRVGQGPYIADGSYVKITKKGYGIYSNFDWKQKNTSTNLYGETFEARGRYEHSNGSTYYSLFNAKNEWQGYINADATTKTSPQGPYISDGRIVKVTKKGYDSWSNFDWNKKVSNDQLLGKNFKAQGRYEHFNGSTYYSLYDVKGNWYGYINSNAVSDGNQEGNYIADGSYVKVAKKGYGVWSNFDWKRKNSSDNLYGQTLQARGRYEHFNGETYYSLYNVKGEWQGYLNATATISANPQGAYIPDGRFVTVDKMGYDVYSDFNWTIRNSSNVLKGNTFTAKGRYEHINGNTYYSIYDNQDKWQGYIDAKAVSVVKNPEGNYIPDGRYVKVNQPGYNVWSNFDWKFRNKSDELIGKTLQARGRYEHANGSTYFSLYDLNGEWQGYINSEATMDAKAEGNYIPDGDYVKVTKKGVDLYSNFSWNKKGTTDSMVDKYYQARGRYEHANGKTYYSLFDSNNVWQGYLESSAAVKITSPQGPYISDGRYFNVVNKGMDVWGSFKENVINSTDSLYGNTYQIRGRYEHVNGRTYYSLYDNKGKWQGYVDSKAGTVTKAEGSYVSSSKYVIVSVKGYDVYSNFDWKVVTNSTKLLGNTYNAKGYYQHFNGYTYYSLYDGDKWIGYINSNAVTQNK